MILRAAETSQHTFLALTGGRCIYRDHDQAVFGEALTSAHKEVIFTPVRPRSAECAFEKFQCTLPTRKQDDRSLGVIRLDRKKFLSNTSGAFRLDEMLGKESMAAQQSQQHK